MLSFALSTLLALQNASASPSVSTESAPQATPAAAEPAATPVPRTTPPPRPRTSPTPAPKSKGGVLIVVNKSDNSISLFEAGSGKLLATVPVEVGPHEAEVMADGKLAAVSIYGRTGDPGRAVLFIELPSGKTVSRVDLGEGSKPHGLHALSDGRLLVTAEGKRELDVVDSHTGKIARRIPINHDVLHMVAASPDGRRAYVSALGSGVVTAIDLSSGKVIGDVATGKGPEGLDVTPDGREVWVANRDANTISIIDARSLKAVFTIHAVEFPIRVKITRDGSRALVSFAGSGDVGIFDVATRAEIKRIPIGRSAVEGAENRAFQKRFAGSPAPVGLLISPDGKRAWVAAGDADVVAVLDLDKLRVEDAWPTGHEPDGLAGRLSTAPEEERPTPAPRQEMRTPRRFITRRPG